MSDTPAPGRTPGWLPWLAHVVAALVLVALVVAVATGLWLDTRGWGFVGFLAIMLVVGWFLAARLPGNAIGWLIMAVPAIFATHVVADVLGRALLTSSPDIAAWLLWYGHDRADLDTWSWSLPLGLMLTQIPLRFPTGRLPSPSWRWFSHATIVVLVVAAAVLSTTTSEAARGVPSPAHVAVSVPVLGGGRMPAQLVVFGILWSAVVAGSFASLVVRYRRAGRQVRAQLRWMLWAAVVAVAVLAVDGLLPEVPVVQQVLLLAFALVPVAIAVAVLRYRLYSIDRIISRTAAYAIVTLVAVGVYAVVVTSVSLLLPDQSAVPVALATLAAAALFLPLLRGVQRRLDRRFDREHYDAEKVVDAFGQRLRDGADPASTIPELVRAVEQTLQPASVGLWMRGGAR